MSEENKPKQKVDGAVESKEQVAESTAVTKENDTASKAETPQEVCLEQGRGGVLGVKAGMTQVYSKDGGALAVTVIDLQKNVITQVKTKAKEGYSAVQVGFVEKKEKAANKPEQGHAKKAGASGFYSYSEFRMPEGSKLDQYQVGQTLNADFVKEGDLVDLCSVSKGKGFQGTMKRYHFSGGPRTHGVSLAHRSGGSLCNHAGSSRVFKNKKMAGQMGNKKVTVQNVRVVRVDKENNLLLVHGSVPGPRSGIVRVTRAIKDLG